jgi:hypothetical protein
MNPEPDRQLAAALHAELRQLPPRPAPARLIPNVLAALARESAAGRTPALQPAWWERSWFEWPRAIRQLAGAATGVMVATLAGLVLLGLNLDLLATWAGSASGAWSTVSALGNTLSLLGRAVPTTALVAVGALLAASYLCALAVGTVFYRYALQRRQTS